MYSPMATPTGFNTARKPTELNQHQKKAADAINAYRQRVATTKADTRLSDQGKQELITELWEGARTEIATIRQQEVDAQQARTDSLRKKLLDPGHVPSSEVISHRDAIDRASRLDREDAAVALMAQATSINDKALERAVLERAYEQRWAGVVNTYEAARPSSADTAEELWNLTQPANDRNAIGAALVASLAYSVPNPAEITAAG